MEKKKTTSKRKAAPDNPKQLPMQYIRQPYPISAIQADLSTRQIRILVAMMKSIQQGVQQMFERGPVNGEMLLFPELKDDHVNIEFRFKDIAARSDTYPDVKLIAEKFMRLYFSYEDKQKGEITLAHFVDKVTFPMRNSKRDKIVFSFTREQAQAVFNFTIYSRYLTSVATSAKSKHTARLYMLFTSARGFEQDDNGTFHWYIGYEQLRRILGCDVKDDSGRWYRKRLKTYKQFKFAVLHTAQSELKSLADNGKSDCWFEFSEQPDSYEGEPRTLDFLVHRIDTDKANAKKKETGKVIDEW